MKNVLIFLFVFFLQIFFHPSHSWSQLTRVTDICPNLCSNKAAYPTEYNGNLYFQAYTTTYGAELWKYNEQDGASLVQEIYVGTADAYPVQLNVYKDKLYFIAYDGTSKKLYSYDGQNPLNVVFDFTTNTYQSYSIFKNILYIYTDESIYSYTGSGSAVAATVFNSGLYPRKLEAIRFNSNYLYFRGRDENGFTHLCKWDGTNTPIDLQIQENSYGIVSGNSAFVGNNFYFVYNGGDPYNQELWVDNNDATSPHIVSEINPSGSAFYAYGGSDLFYVLDDTLYFGAQENTYGLELWKYDGTHTPVRVSDMNPGNGSSYPMFFYWMGNNIVFFGFDNTYHTQLWKYDRVSPPVRISSVNPTDTGLDVYSNLIPFNGAVYFSASDNTHGTQLWKYDGVSQPYMVNNVAAGSPDFLSTIFSAFNPFVFNDALYMAADGNDSYGEEIWKYTSTVTSVIDPQADAQQLVYPNPIATGQTAQLNAVAIPEEIVVINAQGVEIYRGTQMPALSATGLYYIQITTQGKKSVQKLMVQ